MFKPSVPRRWLFFIAAMVWVFAAYRVMLLALKFAPLSPLPVWLNLFLGFAGFGLFFFFVFSKVSRRYIKRIACLKQENPCFFAFFGWKSYLMISIMMTMGILFARFEVLPVFLQGIFYISLSGCLLLSAILFTTAGIRFRGRPDDCIE